MTKLKVLIVEDTQVNLDAAKAFFSTITDYEFVYATNRKDAEKLLEDVYAVITDRSLPSNGEVKFLDCETPNDGKQYFVENIVGANGYHIMYMAHFLGKPVIMASQHGERGPLGLMRPRIVEVLLERQTTDWSESTLKDFSLEKLLMEVDQSPSADLYHQLWQYGNFGGVNFLGWRDGIQKTQEVAWKCTWEKLREQF